MTITLIGAGCGPGTLTREARDAVASAELVLGAKRLLEMHAAGKRCEEAISAEAVVREIRAADRGPVCVLLSGDSGFYSGARILRRELAGNEVSVLPGISSMQLFAARLGRPWQDWGLFSAHGVACDPVAAVCHGRPAFFLTGGKSDPGSLCRTLCQAGLGELPVSVGSDLGTEAERIVQGAAKEFSERIFPTLSVMLAEAAPREAYACGLPDSLLRRTEGVPMTKQEVRAVAMAKLGVRQEDICWDIGAGTGSVAIEMALRCRRVYGVEREKAALAVAEENRVSLGAWNLTLTEGEAPEALEGLPAPDAVFVGGSGGKLKEILNAVYGANPRARLCVSAIALETAQTAVETVEALGRTAEISQIAVSRGRKTGELHMLMANNPVFLISTQP